MATTPCPACGRAVKLPKGYAGGPIPCTNAGCGLMFEPRATAGAVGRAGSRPAGGRPELLDRLPESFATSPPMIAVGAVVAMLYGLVLFGVATSWKKQREAELAKGPPPEPLAVAVAPLTPAPAPAPSPSPSTSSPAPAPTPSPAPGANAEPRPSATETATGEPARSKGETRDPSRESAKPASKSTRPPQPPPAPTPPPPPEPKFERWGALTLAGMSPDCSLRVDGDTLVVTVPGSLHLLNPQAPPANREPPRLLMPVEGDFVAQVRVSGTIRPGTTPLPGLPFPFQGAGLLLWQDAGNYLRFERSSMYSPEGKRYHQVLLEACRDGRAAPPALKDVSDTDLLLRFDRRGSEVRCAYSPDNGRNWIEVKRQQVAFPAKVGLGVAANNASPQAFAPRFDDWELTTGTARGR